MSIWYHIRKEEDVDFNENDGTLEIYIGEQSGDHAYYSIPIELIPDLAFQYALKNFLKVYK